MRMYRRIRELREDSDFTQKELANYLHCSQQAYSNYENGARDIPLSALIKLARFYSVSIDYILEVTDNKKLK